MSILLSGVAFGQTSNSISDNEIKKTHIQMEVQRQKVEREFGSPDAVDENTSMAIPPAPFDASPTELGELQLDYQTESMVHTPSIDPAKLIEQEVYLQQKQQKDREKYRQAIQRQFDDNLEAAGIKTRRNIAEEIKKLEDLEKYRQGAIK